MPTHDFIAVFVLPFFYVVIPIIILVILVKTSLTLKGKYEEAKDKLRKRPFDTNLRSLAVVAGRNYSVFLRGVGLNSFFNEQSIANDLSAIGDPAIGDAISETRQPRQESNDVSIKLQKLSELKKSGLISEAEFEEKRKKILDQI